MNGKNGFIKEVEKKALEWQNLKSIDSDLLALAKEWLYKNSRKGQAYWFWPRESLRFSASSTLPKPSFSPHWGTISPHPAVSASSASCRDAMRPSGVKAVKSDQLVIFNPIGNNLKIKVAW